MSTVSQASLDEHILKLRSGEPDEIREFVETYEPFIRRTIRRRIARFSLNAAADSADICQSAMGSFLIRMAAGQFEFSDRRAIESLLLTIARRKLTALVRHEFADRRNRARTLEWNSAADRGSDSCDDPQRFVDLIDLIAAARRALSAHERLLFDLRQQGLDWNEIAAQIDQPAVVLRKRLSRALRSVALQLGADDVNG